MKENLLLYCVFLLTLNSCKDYFDPSLFASDRVPRNQFLPSGPDTCSYAIRNDTCGIAGFSKRPCPVQGGVTHSVTGSVGGSNGNAKFSGSGRSADSCILADQNGVIHILASYNISVPCSYIDEEYLSQDNIGEIAGKPQDSVALNCFLYNNGYKVEPETIIYKVSKDNGVEISEIATSDDFYRFCDMESLTSFCQASVFVELSFPLGNFLYLSNNRYYNGNNYELIFYADDLSGSLPHLDSLFNYTPLSGTHNSPQESSYVTLMEMDSDTSDHNSEHILVLPIPTCDDPVIDRGKHDYYINVDSNKKLYRKNS